MREVQCTFSTCLWYMLVKFILGTLWYRRCFHEGTFSTASQPGHDSWWGKLNWGQVELRLIISIQKKSNMSSSRWYFRSRYCSSPQSEWKLHSSVFVLQMLTLYFRVLQYAEILWLMFCLCAVCSSFASEHAIWICHVIQKVYHFCVSSCFAVYLPAFFRCHICRSQRSSLFAWLLSPTFNWVCFRHTELRLKLLKKVWLYHSGLYLDS